MKRLWRSRRYLHVAEVRPREKGAPSWRDAGLTRRVEVRSPKMATVSIRRRYSSDLPPVFVMTCVEVAS